LTDSFYKGLNENINCKKKRMKNTYLIKFGNYTLQPADVIVIKKLNFTLFDHYLVYLGGKTFIAHTQKGICRMTIEELQQFTGDYAPVRMRKFIGTELQRRSALLRANECLQPSYSLLFSNCEHFADYVQYGKRTSLQAAKAGIGLIVAGSAMIGKSKNQVVQTIGGLSIAAGIFALLNEASGDNNNSLSPFYN
jgi:hypothetical protein